MNTFKKLKIKFSAFFLLTALPVFVMFGQPASLEYDVVSYPVSSGIYDGNGESTMLVWSEILDLRDVPWLRLEFGDTYLGNESYLLITSVLDGSTQRLNSISIAEWYNSSAFFNGSAVELELFVDSRDASVYVEVTNILIGIPPEDGPGTEAICGEDDNRISSSNPAVGRLLTITLASGCSGWIVENGKHVTAGHCASSGVTGVLQFNVPKSTSNGTIKHPHPDHQYSVNQQSISHNAGGIGNDWAVFEVFNNSNTNLQPIQAQNAFFNVVQNNSGSQLRVTGYGVDGPPPYFGSQGQRNSDNQTQQTHIGSNMNSSGNVIRHSSDTQGGNSGSPIIDESTGFAIGIHTHGGCTNLGYNHGTSAFNTGFWSTLYPTVTVTIDQKWADGSRLSGTTVGRWNGISFTNLNITTNPAKINLNTGTTEVFRGYQEIVDNEKYRVWERNQAEQIDSIQNHRGFQVTPELNNLTSRFHDTHSGVTIKNVLEGTSATGGILFFYDPWLIDYPDPAFGNQKRNRGMDALPKQRNSPFYPDYTTNYNGDVYQGVFLNQNPQFQSDLPIYNVWAEDQQINLGGSLGIRQFYFQNWTANGANLLPFGAGNQNRVVFTSGDAVVQANLKGTQLSSNTNGFSNSSQRKFIATLYPNYYYHLVYSSGGSVWYEKALINSEVVQPLNWQLMNNAKPINGDFFYTEGKSPSIDFCYATHEFTEENYFIYIVYQKKKTDNKYEIILSKFNQSGVKIFDIQVFSSEHTDFSTFDCMPVVGVSRQKDDLVPIKVVVLWRRPAEGSATAGLYYVAGFDQGTSINWTDSYPTPYKISTTDINSTNPSLAVFKSPLGNISYHLAYQQGTSQIKYTDIVFGVNGSNAETPVVISTGSGSSTNITPSITVNNIRFTYPVHEREYDSPKVVWCTGYEGCGVYRSKPNKFAAWSPFYVYIENDDVQSPTISGPKYHPSGSDDVFHFGWSWLVGYYKSYVSTSNLAIKRSLPYIGNDIQIANNFAEWDGFGYCVLSNFSGTPAPFTFQNKWVDYGLYKPGNNIQAGRAGTIIKDDAEFYFALGDIKLNDNEVDFVSVSDTLANINLNDLNSSLVSESFEVNDNSILNYSIFYGFNDSLLAYNSLSETDQIDFKVEIIDDQTLQVLGVHHNIAQSKEDLTTLENTSYQINMQGIGNREIRLRLTAGNNFTSDYSLSKIYSFNQSLGKENISILKWDGSEVITEYALEQNYPNPFNPGTTIRYQIPQDGMVTLKVYDILGSEVATLVNELKSAGRYEVNFDASRLASGVYIYNLKSGEYLSSKKMLLVK